MTAHRKRCMTSVENEQNRVELADRRVVPLSSLPWWQKDKYGWPIEIMLNRPVANCLRIICQNIRKVTG